MADFLVVRGFQFVFFNLLYEDYGAILFAVYWLYAWL